MSRPPEEIKVQ